MEQLPKIVRERLRATAKPGAHPDPDLLTAFAEKSLNERERGMVLEHLSQCAECREVVSLSQPEMELAHVAVAAVAAARPPAPARSRWLRGPVLGWGALAACAVIVAGVVLSYRGQEKSAQFVALKQEQPTMTAAQSEAKVTTIPKDEMTAKLEPSRRPQSPSKSRTDVENSPAVAKAMPSARQLKREAEPVPLAANQVAADQVTTKAASQPGAGFGALGSASGGIAGNAGRTVAGEARSVAQSVSVQAEPQQAVVPQTREKVEVATGGPEASPKQVENKPVTAAAAPVAPPPPSVTLDTTDTTAEYAQHTGATFQGLKSNEVALRKTANPASPRWTVSSGGSTLMRSFDNGTTWQMIPVAKGMTLRAVASVGLQVWVGGTGGALYHSSDAGEHWLQLRPSSDGVVLKTDIVSLDFADAQNGKLTTADGTTWITSDGGRTWQKK
jgi:Photosynthesis system II assembly factor YCF48/Putative zinc-finger